MACFSCGSSRGTSTVLCPACAAKKAHRGKAPQRSEPLPTTSDIVQIIPFARISKFFACALVGYFVCFSSYGPGWGLSSSDLAYKRCMRQVGSAIKNSMGSYKPRNSEEQAAVGIFKVSAVSMAEGTCANLRTQCRQNKEICDQILSVM